MRLLVLFGVVFTFVVPQARVDAAGVRSQAASPTYATGLSNAVSIKATPSGKGFLVLGRDGTVLAYGDAPQLGNATLPHAAVTVAVTHSGAGYWVFDANGCTVPKGDAAPFAESICSTPLNGPVLDAATNPNGAGYWLVASDGGIFAFGGAPFKGSMGGVPLNGPVVGMAPAPDGLGYWEVASDGGIFSFGEPFFGSMGATPLNRPVAGMVASGSGYMMVGADGGVFNFGNPFFGSLGSNPPAKSIVSIAPSFDGFGSPNGYWMLDSVGNVYAFGAAWTPPPPPPPPFVFPGDGTFRVGIDIGATTYRTVGSPTGCYWERLSGFGGTFGEIIANDFASGPRVVTISPSDAGFHTSGCGQWTSSTAPTTASLTSPLPASGMFRVGIDIAPGTWTALGTTNCYWARLSGFGGTFSQIITNNFGSGNQVVTVLASDVGFEVSSCTPFTKS